MGVMPTCTLNSLRTVIPTPLSRSGNQPGRGSFTSASIAYIASPISPPYVGKQLTTLFHTQPMLKCLVLQYCSTNGKLRILVKAQPSTPSTWPLSPTRLGIRQIYFMNVKEDSSPCSQFFLALMLQSRSSPFLSLHTQSVSGTQQIHRC